MSFVERQISVTFQLVQPLDANGNPTGPQPTFDGVNNTVTVTGLRMSAEITKAGGVSMGQLQLRIWGLPLSTMNKLSTLGLVPGVIPRNLVSVSAGDAESGLSLVYQGNVTMAYTEAGAAPGVSFTATAYSMYSQAAQSAASTSYKGGADVAVIMQGLATRAGFNFQNDGVAGIILSNPYFSGSLRDQISECAQHAGINFVVDNNTLHIWPRGGSRSGQIPLISAETGMIGYPSPSGVGLMEVVSLFQPGFNFGGLVQVQSSITPACGQWQINALYHKLEAQVPDGEWFTRLTLIPPGYLAPS